MNIVYTLHAEEQIRERKITKTWVEDTIKWPDTIEHLGNKYYVVKKLNGKVLKVVYIKEGYIKIITAHFTK